MYYLIDINEHGAPKKIGPFENSAEQASTARELMCKGRYVIYLDVIPDGPRMGRLPVQAADRSRCGRHFEGPPDRRGRRHHFATRKSNMETRNPCTDPADETVVWEIPAR